LLSQNDALVRDLINTNAPLEIKGKVNDALSNLPLEFVTIYISELQSASETNDEGLFAIELKEDAIQSLNLVFNYIGYEEFTLTIDPQNIDAFYNVQLRPKTDLLNEITVVGTSFKDIIGVPVSLKTTSNAMIQSNAGGGGDFTKIMQSLPGLATINSFRNDLIVRGGSPTENTFFIEDIEIPYINHLSTQGSTGGTISILNAHQINEVDFIASGFPANRPDAMSGVFNIYLVDPFKEKKVVFGADPTNVFLSGAYQENNTSISYSLRKSYRELLLKQIGLAVLPNYSDYLFNVRQRLNKNSYVSFLLVGAIDKFKVNQDVNDSEIQQYLRDNLPSNQQSSLTAGASYKYIADKSTISLKVSGSDFRNSAQKSNSIGNLDVDILNYSSYEKQYTGQLEIYNDLNAVKIKYGGGIKLNEAAYNVQNQFYNNNGLNDINYQSKIDYNLSHLFLQTTYNAIPSKLQLTLHNTVQFSDVKNAGMLYSVTYPRINGKLTLIPTADFNFSIGQYSQLPENILLSYQQNSNYVNLENTEFIKSFQVVTGFEFLKEDNKNQFTVEGFYKRYSNYPFNRREQISLANFGADFGVVGNVPVDFSGIGRAYGIEFFFKRTNAKKLSGWISYALSKSEFLDANSNYVASSWDARHIVNAVAAYRLNDRWTLSLNAKYQSALPFTPFDLVSSSFVPVWDVNRIGIRDYSQLNVNRGKSTTLIDMRIQRTYTWKGKAIKVYLDLENILVDADSQQVLVFDRNSDNMPVIINPMDVPEAQRYKLKELQNAEGVFIPSMGFEIKF